MRLFNYNEMFILALVALSIVGIICLGLLVVLAIFALEQKREKGQQVNLQDTGNSSSKSPSHPQDEKKSYLTVSDWVHYLTSEKFGIMGTVLNASAVLVAGVALIYSTSTHTLWSSITNGIVALSLTGYLFMKIFRPFEQRGKVAERILGKVMSGELQSEESIRKAWLDGLNPRRRSETSVKPTKN